MSPKDLVRLIEHPNTFDLSMLSDLESWTQSYPYFSIPYVVLAKSLKTTDRVEQASLRIGNRAQLHMFVERDYYLAEENPLSESDASYYKDSVIENSTPEVESNFVEIIKEDSIESTGLISHIELEDSSSESFEELIEKIDQVSNYKPEEKNINIDEAAKAERSTIHENSVEEDLTISSSNSFLEEMDSDRKAYDALAFNAENDEHTNEGTTHEFVGSHTHEDASLPLYSPILLENISKEGFVFEIPTEYASDFNNVQVIALSVEIDTTQQEIEDKAASLEEDATDAFFERFWEVSEEKEQAIEIVNDTSEVPTQRSAPEQLQEKEEFVSSSFFDEIILGTESVTKDVETHTFEPIEHLDAFSGKFALKGIDQEVQADDVCQDFLKGRFHGVEFPIENERYSIHEVAKLPSSEDPDILKSSKVVLDLWEDDLKQESPEHMIGRSPDTHQEMRKATEPANVKETEEPLIIGKGEGSKDSLIIDARNATEESSNNDDFKSGVWNSIELTNEVSIHTEAKDQEPVESELHHPLFFNAKFEEDHPGEVCETYLQGTWKDLEFKPQDTSIHEEVRDVTIPDLTSNALEEVYKYLDEMTQRMPAHTHEYHRTIVEIPSEKKQEDDQKKTNDNDRSFFDELF